MTDFRQTFKHVDQLRLEIGLPHPTEPNVLRTDDALGAFGWVTPVAGTAIEAWGSGNPPPGWTGGFWGGGFRFTTPSYPVSYAPAVEFSTVPAPIAVGQWAASRLARYLVTGGAASAEIRTEFLDAAGAVLAASASTTATVTAAVQAPANTVSVRMVVKAVRSAVGGRTLLLNGEQIVTAATAAAANTAVTGYKPYVNSWVNVIGPTHSIEVERGELDVGTLTARILDASIDPAVSTLIRPGRPCKLSVANGFEWEPLFTGTLTDAAVQYDPVRALQGDPRHAQITIAAVDAVTTLASQRMPYGVAEIAHLRSVLEGAGVPWNINGNRNQLAAVIPAVSVNDNATMLDQVAITRDSKAGYAWVDRRGVLNVWDQPTLDSIIAFGKTNLITNPNFETDVSGWTAVNGTLLRDAQPTVNAAYGKSVMRYTSTAAVGGGNYLYSSPAAVTAGTTYTGSFSLRMGATAMDHRILLRFYDSGGAAVAGGDALVVVPAAQLSATTFTRMWATGTAPAGAVTARVYAFASSALAVGQKFDVDGFMLTEGDEALAFFEGTVQQSFSERQYSDIALAFSSKHLINEVNVKSLEWDPADPTKTIEVIYGPYRDEASVREWRPQRREFTVHGLNLAAIQSLALAILTRNKTPAVRANTITVPISTTGHINQRALLELYNLVAVGLEPKNFTATLRVTGIRHSITERGWVMSFEFGPATGVALPQATPSVAQ